MSPAPFPDRLLLGAVLSRSWDCFCCCKFLSARPGPENIFSQRTSPCSGLGLSFCLPPLWDSELELLASHTGINAFSLLPRYTWLVDYPGWISLMSYALTLIYLLNESFHFGMPAV